MAKFYDHANNNIYWSDEDIACVVEDAYFELSDFLALKRLDGHDICDQWYMAVHRKLSELMDVLDDSPLHALFDDEKTDL